VKKLKAVELVKNLKDISQFDWECLNDEMDFSLLIKDPSHRNRKVNPQILDDKFCELHDEYNKLTKNEEQIEKIIILMQKLVNARYLVGIGDASQKNWINQYEAMLEEMTRPDDEFNPVKLRISIQQAYGMAINVKEVSAYEFVQITNLVQEQAARKTQKNSNNGEN
jgi:hypothetical protein